ncbi:MAG: primosomal protein, partial [Alphaproteobacteria bacterium]|nr:primosomal protein [Alphaproteobacteria bacterium]
MSRARLILLNAALGPLDYRVPHGMAVEPGSIVVAPLGPRQMLGVVWEPERLPAEEVGDNRLRPLLHAYDVPPLSEPLRRLIEWTAAYYLAPIASVLRMALASTSALERGRKVTEYRATGLVPERLTPQRRQALERIGERQGLVRELALAASVSDAVIRGLVKGGAIEAVDVSLDDPFPAPDPDHDPPALEPAQEEAAAALVAAVTAADFAPFLLDGVTGSGKTEVYFEAIAESLRRGRQVLIMLPEIALTVQFLERFAARFGVRPAEWHSDLSQKERRRTYRAVMNGEARVVVGARSSLFLPFPELGLII